MKISALVSSLWIDDEKPSILKRCLDSLVGADEILSLVTHDSTPLGFADSWNRLATLSTGDYIVFIGDNNIMTLGNLKELCIPNTVTSPSINGGSSEFQGMVFCMPRNIYNQIGLYDMKFNYGCHWEDIDLWRRIKENNIELKVISAVNFNRPQGGRTIDLFPDHIAKKRLNHSLYIEKWGDDKRFL